jgi:hypothetical protein
MHVCSVVLYFTVCLYQIKNTRKMKKQNYINAIIKTNLKLGYTVEQIMNDLEEAHKRHLRNESKSWAKMEEFLNTPEGFTAFRNRILA